MVLPPGAGKTRVGIEAVAARLDEDPDTRAVVLVPNTAIQAQWVSEARAWGLDASDDKDLASPLTCLTYQSLAVFEAEVEDEETGPVVDRLHPNGVALFERIRAQRGLVLVLDECHHLLEVWGRLLAELLEAVDSAHVLALTATPPESLSGDQLRLVNTLFGEILYRVSVPAVVKEGHLAPFDELVWLTTPTAGEEDWLAQEAERFTELTTMLTTPGFGTVGFYEWLTARFVDPVPETTTWGALTLREPELCAAALRMHHAGLLALPVGARLGEEHRQEPGAEDWVLLLGDWLLAHVAVSGEPADDRVIEAVRAALPAIGYQWTRRGIRRGRSPVDRVLARSAAKPVAAAQIIAAERLAIHERARVLVLCDHERASATVPLTLRGVVSAAAGSAIAVLETFLADPAVAALNPMLVTGSVVAGSVDTLRDLVDFVARSAPELASRLVVDESAGVATCSTGWTSRTWVRHVTAFFETGGTQVLVGTRGLLGEGWNARSISTLIDLTTATTLTAVVQTRGRALRTDPGWPDKVATNWTVVCVSESHPKGDNDWDRLVRKHQGFYGVDPDGDIVDGVAHIHPDFSPYAPPPVARFDELNAAMVREIEQRDGIREAWAVGEPYDDHAMPTLRIRRADAQGTPPSDELVTLMPQRPRQQLSTLGLKVHEAPPEVSWLATVGLAGGSQAAMSLVGAISGTPWALTVGALGAGVAAVAGLVTWHRAGNVYDQWLAERLSTTRELPSLESVAAAVADALAATGHTTVGSAALVVELHPGAEYRFRLDGTEEDAATFAAVFDEAVGPVISPRYLVSRYTDATLPEGFPGVHSARAARAALKRVRPAGEAWHPVPTLLGHNRRSATAYRRAWDEWVGNGRLLATATPEGAGMLAAVTGDDPFAVTTVVRQHWS